MRYSGKTKKDICINNGNESIAISKEKYVQSNDIQIQFIIDCWDEEKYGNYVDFFKNVEVDGDPYSYHDSYMRDYDIVISLLKQNSVG